ncbi:hypothetical protein EV361DRAFT_1036989 [Lentinula raphanica]|nr:hypothetical protein EV361DRAFT_1036989 [Lentinula raphanica]
MRRNCQLSRWIPDFPTAFSNNHRITLPASKPFPHPPTNDFTTNDAFFAYAFTLSVLTIICVYFVNSCK